jgi:hypothetical protein
MSTQASTRHRTSGIESRNPSMRPRVFEACGLWPCERHRRRVYIVFLPAACSHLLQPLDVAIFGPLKTAFKKYLDQQGGHDTSSTVAKKRFLFCYHKARMEVITEVNICSGWWATGLWPISRHRALGSHFIKENRWQKRVSGKESAAICALISVFVDLRGSFLQPLSDRKSYVV